MKYSKHISLLLVFLLALFLVTGCGTEKKLLPDSASSSTPTQIATPELSETPEPTEITLTDMAGRQVSLAAPADKVVALAAADCEILYAIGAGDTLIGRGEYCDYPIEVKNIPSVQSGYETNIEQIISLKPQLLIMSKMGQTMEQVNQLENAGIKVVVSDAQNIEGVYTSIGLLGRLTGKDTEAEALISNMKSGFEAVLAKASGKEGKTVYFEVSPIQYGLWTAGSGTFMDELAAMLGLENSFKDITGWGEISEEQVIERNPDYIVTISMYFGEGPEPEEEIMARPGWENITAVKNKTVIAADADELSRPSPRLVEGLITLYDYIYVESD